MAKFQMMPLVTANARRVTARLADAKDQDLNDNDKFKLVKLKGDSQYGLCATGDAIEGFVVALSEPMKYDGFVLGTVQTNERFIAVAEDAIAALDYVVAGAPTARNAVIGAAGPKVKKSDSPTKWRVVAVIKGTGAGAELVVEYQP